MKLRLMVICRRRHVGDTATLTPVFSDEADTYELRKVHETPHIYRLAPAYWLPRLVRL